MTIANREPFRVNKYSRHVLKKGNTIIQTKTKSRRLNYQWYLNDF